MAAAAVQSVPVIEPRAHVGQQSATQVPKHDVTTNLNFYQPNADGSPPPPTYTEKPESYQQQLNTQQVLIRDIAGEEDNFSLDRNGFQIYQNPATERDFIDDEKIKSGYYAETEKLLKDVTGADRVFIFDHTIRQLPAGTQGDKIIRAPVQQVHVDQTYAASLTRVPHHLPEEAEELVKGRVQVINVWRPISTVRKDPLAFANAQSVPESDLVPRQLISPTRNGETFNVLHSPGQKWYYRSGLTPDQVILIKCFDSKTDGRARRVPHSAFIDPAAPSDAPTRESIEIRALVFHTTDRD